MKGKVNKIVFFYKWKKVAAPNFNINSLLKNYKV